MKMKAFWTPMTHIFEFRSHNATGNDTSGDADWTLGSDDESSGGLRRTWHSRT